MNWLQKLKTGLSKSSAKVTSGFVRLIGKRRVDPAWLTEIEDELIMADFGPEVAAALVQTLRKKKLGQEIDQQELRSLFAQEIEDILRPVERPLNIATHKPHVVLMVGVNGSGKTTTIGKLAHYHRGQGRKVMIAAGDTFRAAAIEQLTAWAQRADVPILAKAPGADPAGLAYDAMAKAHEAACDLLLIDTAGRLHNRADLMAELGKIVRVVKKIDPEAPHDCLLVLDATIGQNALAQTETFRNVAAVSGLVVTKLDGTAKGGMLVALAKKFNLPVAFIGVGEGIDDLQPFTAKEFSRSLLGFDPS